MSDNDITPEQYLELGMTRKALILDLVKGIDSDLVMLARDEWAAQESTTTAERASRRLMNLVALIEPDLIDRNPEETP